MASSMTTDVVFLQMKPDKLVVLKKGVQTFDTFHSFIFLIDVVTFVPITELETLLASFVINTFDTINTGIYCLATR